MSTTPKHLYMKHMFSCLPDQTFDIEVDEERKVVTLGIKVFDASLVASVVTDGLARDGIVAYRDDGKPMDLGGLGVITPNSPYQLQIRFAGQEFRSQVVILVSGITTVTLEPQSNAP